MIQRRDDLGEGGPQRQAREAPREGRHEEGGHAHQRTHVYYTILDYNTLYYIILYYTVL